MLQTPYDFAFVTDVTQFLPLQRAPCLFTKKGKSTTKKVSGPKFLDCCFQDHNLSEAIVRFFLHKNPRFLEFVDSLLYHTYVSRIFLD